MRMTMVDGAVCDLGHAQDRVGDGAGCSKCRAQIRGGDNVFLQEHRRRCPHENGWRRIERLLDEDRRRVAPPPEKATTPVGWLDHERHRCSLEGAATTSSFGSVDDERRRTAGRRKPILERKKKSAATNEPWGTISGAPRLLPPPSLISFPRSRT